jgi:oxygen-independent coproporphyrinogen-3 oxidase
MQQQGYQWLANQGYERYEISAYAQANQASWHNLNYWRFGDYIGIGAGAHGKLTDLTNRGIKRTWKTRSAKDYLARDKSFLAGSRWLTPAELPLEYLMNGLRLIRGISVAGLENYAGTRLAQIKSQLDMAVNRGLLIYNKDKITTTELGLNFLNDCLQLFN